LIVRFKQLQKSKFQQDLVDAWSLNAFPIAKLRTMADFQQTEMSHSNSDFQLLVNSILTLHSEPAQTPSSMLIVGCIYSKISFHFCKDCGIFSQGEWEEEDNCDALVKKCSAKILMPTQCGGIKLNQAMMVMMSVGV
jgi:hypothetical protein